MHKHANMNKVYRLVWNASIGAWQAVAEIGKGAGKANSHARRHRQRIAALLGSLFLVSSQVYAASLPQDGTISLGSGSIQQPNSNTLNITQTSNKLAIDWQSFSVGAGNSVNFIQPSASAIALNRVVGNDVSHIQGAINANGQVFLINPNGVLFSTTAQVNVGGLIASTRDISNENFSKGHFTFDGGGSNAIINQGNISTADGGYVVMIAAKIDNQGSIYTPQGTTALAAGDRVTVDMGGPVKVSVEQGAIDALIQQGGIIKAEGGHILLTAKAAGDLASTVINHTGISEATSLVAGENGRIALIGDMDNDLISVGGSLIASKEVHIQAASVDVEQTAQLDVSSDSQQGGKVAIEATHIQLKQGSQINADGALGGGEVLVGGDWQGSGDMHQATTVTMEQGASINASATEMGDGGKVVLWSDVHNEGTVTEVRGSITALGGSEGGDGGEVETSGYLADVVGAEVLVGEGGRWLIDPATANVSSSSNATLNGGGSVEVQATDSINVTSDVGTGNGTLDLKSPTINNAYTIYVKDLGIWGDVTGGGTLQFSNGTLRLWSGATSIENNIYLAGGNTTFKYIAGPTTTTVTYVAVGGGGGGGGTNNSNKGGGGGGGGGEVKSGSTTVNYGTSFTVNVGSGGAGGSTGNNGGAGGTTTIRGGVSTDARGGGGGTEGDGSANGNAKGGNSGNGISGGRGRSEGGGGGGGANGGGAEGEDISGAGAKGGKGGDGLAVAGFGTFGGGGGGGTRMANTSSTNGAGGSGGGGAGGGNAGTAGTGGGGGGARLDDNDNRNSGGAGGSGRVIIRYTDPYGEKTLIDRSSGSETKAIPILDNDFNTTFNGVISGSGALTMQAAVPTGSGGSVGKMTFNADNTYSGGTKVESGTLVTKTTTALGSGAVTLDNTSGVKLDVQSSLNIDSLMGGGTTGGNVTLANGTNLSIGSGTYDGVISGSGALTKTGNGTFTLTNNSTYTGTTNIDNASGILVLQNNAPTTSSSGFNGIGTLRIEPTATSFTGAFDTNGWHFGNTTALGNLILGKDGNTAALAINSDVKVNATTGQVTLYGGTITQGAAANNNIVANTLLVKGGATTLSNANNDVVTLAANTTGNFTYVDVNALTVGTVGGVNGITASSGAVNLTTNSGLLTLGNVTGNNLTASSTGGNIQQTAGTKLTITNTSDLNAHGKDIMLNNDANDFGDTVTVSGKDVSLKDKNALTVAGTATGGLTTSAGATTFGETIVSGNLNTTATGNVTQTGKLEVAGSSTLTSDQDITLANAGNDFIGDVTVEGVNVSLKDRNDLTVASATATGNLITDAVKTEFGTTNVAGNLQSTTHGADAAGGVSQTAATSMMVGGTANFIADTGTNQVAVLGNDGNNFVGAVSFTNANNGSWKSATIADSTDGLIFGDVNVAGDFTADSTSGAINQSAGSSIIVAGDADFTASNNGQPADITLNNDGNDFQGMVSLDGDNVAIKDDTGGLVFSDVNAAGDLDVTSTDGDIIQTNGSVVNVSGNTNLDSGANDINLGNDNSFGGTVSLTGDDASVKDVEGDLTFDNVVLTGDLNAASTSGDINQSAGSSIIVAGDADFTASDNGQPADITLNNDGNDFQGMVSLDGDNVAIKDDTGGLILGDVNTTGHINTQSTGGAISQAAGTSVDIAGTSRFNATNNGQPADITLANNGNDFAAPVTLNGNNISIADANGNLTFGNVNAAQNFNAQTTGGAINQTETTRIVVAGSSNLSAAQGGGSANITLANPTNDFRGPVSLYGKDVLLNDIKNGGITYGTVNVEKLTFVKSDKELSAATAAAANVGVNHAMPELTLSGSSASTGLVFVEVDAAPAETDTNGLDDILASADTQHLGGFAKIIVVRGGINDDDEGLE